MILSYLLFIGFCVHRIIGKKDGGPAYTILSFLLIASGLHLVLMIFLAEFGLLRPVPMVLCAGGLALCSLALPSRGLPGAGPVHRSLVDRSSVWRFFRRDFLWVFAGLFLVTLTWLLAAAWLLPPRTIDDLTYHLPAMYEFVLRGRFITMPADQIPTMAYPRNGDLLLSWPLIFVRDVSMTGLMGVLVLFWGTASVYALSRRLGLEASEAVISGMVYFFMPVALALSGTGYVEIICSVYTVLGAYFILHFRQTRDPYDLYLSSLALGILVGMKYSMIIVVGYLGLVLLFLAWRNRWQEKVLAGLLFVLTGGYWYFQNWLVYGSPVFPIKFADRSFGVLYGLGESLDLPGLVKSFGHNFLALVSNDAGAGALYGGFGLTIQALGWLSVGIVFIWMLRQKRCPDQYIVFGLLPVALLFLSLLGDVWLSYDVRLILFVMPVICYSIGRVLYIVEKKEWLTLRSTLIGMVLVFSFWSVTTLATVRFPSYEIGYPLRDLAEGRYISPLLYTCRSSHVLDPCFFWATLDALTVDAESPWRIRQYHDPPYVFTASLYGSRLQNRVDGLSAGKAQDADAVIVMYASCRAGESCRSSQRLAETYKNDPRYLLVADTARSLLFIRKDHMQRPEALKLIARIKKEWGARYVESLLVK